MKIARLPDGSPEVFLTLQGEGVTAGVPAIFVRSSLCNLHCRWCDTDYTWNWVGTPWPHERDGEPGYAKFRKEDHLLTMTATEVAAAIQIHPCRRLVLTGGEPMLQQDEFREVLEILRQSDPSPPWLVEVETNGTIAPDPAFDALVAQYNVSPKLANSGNPTDLRLREAALLTFAATSRAWFKFVITSAADLAEVEALRHRLQLPADRLLLMPEGRDPETLHARRLWLADRCRDLGYRFSDRLHLHLWGPARAR